MSIPSTRLLYRAATAAASVVLAAGALFGGVAGAPPAFADEPATSQEVARFEADFMKDMIDHHALAVLMAPTCLEKATHEKLENLCQKIADSQSAQIEQMQGWLQDWYGITHEPKLSPGDKQSAQRLERLSGAKYEIRFMRSMIRHHGTAVTESQRCLDRAEHPALLDLCHTIRRSNSKQIEQMQDWLEQWYDRKSGQPGEY